MRRPVERTEPLGELADREAGMAAKRGLVARLEQGPVICAEGFLFELERRGADVVGLNCFRSVPTMMPLLEEVRAAVQGHVAGLPVPYRTSPRHPTFFNLPDRADCACPSPHGRTFPTALDPLSMNRYEIRQWAETAYAKGVAYLGLCCGNNPMLTRAVAEAVGRLTEASRFSERMQHHFMYGDHARLPEHMKSQGAKA